MRWIIVLIFLFLAGCGQKGDLYLQEPPSQEADVATSAEDDEKKEKKP